MTWTTQGIWHWPTMFTQNLLYIFSNCDGHPIFNFLHPQKFIWRIDVYTNPQIYQRCFPVLLNQRHFAHLFLIKNASKLSDQTYNGNLCSDSPQLLAVATDAMISPHQRLQVCKTCSEKSQKERPSRLCVAQGIWSIDSSAVCDTYTSLKEFV